MWSTFALGVALGALFLYLPGCMALRGLGMPLVASVGCAPFLALLAYGALAMGLELVGIPCLLYTSDAADEARSGVRGGGGVG